MQVRIDGSHDVDSLLVDVLVRLSGVFAHPRELLNKLAQVREFRKQSSARCALPCTNYQACIATQEAVRAYMLLGYGQGQGVLAKRLSGAYRKPPLGER